jgi:hypothetical protein
MKTMTIAESSGDKKQFVEMINGVKIKRRDMIELYLPNEFKDIDLEFQRICARNGYNDKKIIRYRMKEWVDKMKTLEDDMVYE